MKIAADVMKSDLITVSEEARIDEAINLMVKHVLNFCLLWMKIIFLKA
jgi:CBS domain-containing protein